MMISERERQNRQAVCDYARASTELEGFDTSPEELELEQRYVNGEISLEEMGRILRSGIVEPDEPVLSEVAGAFEPGMFLSL